MNGFTNGPDRNVQSVINKHIQRENTGYDKYGCTTERTDLTRKQWLQHLQDELMDAAVYAEVLMSKEKSCRIETLGSILGNYEEFVGHRWQGGDLNYCVVALAGEAGELANAYKKHTLRTPGTRGHDPEDKMLDEAGDILFYLTRLCQMKGISLADLMKLNTEKLEKRYAQKVDHSENDE